MEHEFRNIREALDAGYRLVRKIDKDVSGACSFGYDYMDSDGNYTVSVWFTDTGKFRAMFPPLEIGV